VVISAPQRLLHVSARNPVSITAYYCTGVRAQDARSANPLVGDAWAERFMDAEGRAFFEQFTSFTIPNASNVVRHHVIDEILRTRLAADPRRRIVLIGAGFDARALRLDGGDWFEVDEAPIVERKDAVAPAAQAPNPLTRIAMDFARESIADRLAAVATDAPTTVVMEGVLYYLEPEAVIDTLRMLSRLFPRHELVCDLQSDAFVRRWGRPIINRIQTFGARWRFHPPDPAGYIEGRGYRLERTTSIPLEAARLGRIGMPAWVIRRLLPSLRDGFRVCVFSRLGSSEKI
jgi:methyltransferase (TIGR00027 family)